MSNQFAPVPIVPGDGDPDAELGEVEVGDEVVLDPDIDGDLIDGAEADRLASGDPDASDRHLL